MIRYKIDKLVRDNIPQIMTEQYDCKVEYRTMEIDEYIQRLRNKIVEEAKELQEARHRKHIIEEFADVLEVVEALRIALDISGQEIAEKRANKNAEDGSFAGRIYNEFVETDNAEAIAYYEAQPQKYPRLQIAPYEDLSKDSAANINATKPDKSE